MKNRISYLALLAVAGVLASQSPALAADAGGYYDLPAVSGFNGKLEGAFGWADIDKLDSGAILGGGASISIPLGHDFGVQLDAAVVDVFDDTMIGGNAHVFTRDPGSYLLGVTGGAATGDDADIYYVGPEGELYLNNLSIEAWAGYLNLDWNGAGSNDKAFGILDLGWYATDNLRLTIGGSSIADFESVHGGFEWQIFDTGLPMSLKADVRYGEDDYVAAEAGFTIYFGGASKSLIDRHRQDDPRNRTLDLFHGAGNAFHAAPKKHRKPPPPKTPEEKCIEQGGEWINGECIFPNPG